MEVALLRIALVSIVALSALTTSAEAEIRRTGCSERALMVDRLEGRYAETRRGGGMEVSQGVVELYVSEEGSWTLLLTQPNGMSCPLAAGEGWRDLEPMPRLEGDPT